MFLTPLLIHRKLPVTARTAGRRDRPEAPTATPAFILRFFRPPTFSATAGANLAALGAGSLLIGAGSSRAAAAGTRPPHAPAPPLQGYGCHSDPSGAHRGQTGRRPGIKRQAGPNWSCLPRPLLYGVLYRATLSRKFMNIWATSARVAVPVGASTPSPRPVIRPASTAHSRAATAHSLTAFASR